jgi:pyruvate/2-oxoglutarate dehydrogenase complex dihydrolipoamide dehydrogenase (E3) component
LIEWNKQLLFLTISKNRLRNCNMLECRYLVLGAGQTGLSIAKNLAKQGEQVVLVEQSLLGGSYVYTQDIPLKTLLHESIDFASSLRLFKDHPTTFPILLKHRQKIAQKIKQEIKLQEKNIQDELGLLHNLKVVYGRGEFVSKTLLEVNSETERHLINFENCVVATGYNHMLKPEISGIDEIPFLYQYTAFLFEEIPSRLAIIGCSLETLQVAYVYANLGVKVDIYETKDSQDCVKSVDKTVLNYFFKKLLAKQVDFFFRHKVTGLEYINGQVGITVENGQNFTASHVYVHVKESFDDEHLNLAKIGLKYTKKGIVTEKNGRTIHKHIWAFGECSSINNPGNKQILIQDFLDRAKIKLPRKESQISVPLLTGAVQPASKMVEQDLKAIKTQVYKLGNYDIATLGFTEPEALALFGPQAKTHVVTTPTREGMIKFVYKQSNNQIIGISLAGEFCTYLEAYSLQALERNTTLKEVLGFLKGYWNI